MVAPGLEGTGDPCIELAPIVGNRARLAVERMCAPDLSPQGETDRLVAEADPEDRDLAALASNQVDRDAPIFGMTRSGRDNDPGWSEIIDLLQRDPVVPVDNRVGPQLTDELHEVVGKGIVVIDDEYHDAPPAPSFPARAERSSARRMAS